MDYSESDSFFSLSLCPTGNVPQKSDTPHIPISAEEIAEQVLECAEIGITSVHLHARHKDGSPAWEKERFAEIIIPIRKEKPDLIICVTTSGRHHVELKRRTNVLELDDPAKADMASLTLSSLNFSGAASTNSPKDIQALANQMREVGIVPELEVFDSGMLNYLHYLENKGTIQGPFFINLILGGVATAQATPEDLGLLRSKIPAGSVWNVGGIGRSQLRANILGLVSGGGVRVGLEDNLHLDSARKRLASNKELVKRIIDIGHALERQVMPPTALRSQLEMPEGRKIGPDAVQ